MRTKINFIALVVCCLITASVAAQYQSGLRLENYSGVSSIFINPASSNSFPLRWDLNLASADIYADNSIAYISNTSLGDLIKNGDQIKAGWEMEGQSNGTMVADFYRDTTRNNYMQFNTTINGPAFLFNTNGGQSLGVFYNFRTMGGSPNLPGSLNYYNYISKSINEWIDFPSLDFSFMAWDEIGVHFSQRIGTAVGYASFGVNLKMLRGYEAAFLSLNNDTELQFISSNQVVLSGLDFEYGYTTSNLDIAENQTYNRNIAGKGFGIDLGFNYVVEDDSDTYKFRLGASLNDIGAIKFRENSEVHGLSGDQSVTFDESTYQSFTTIDEVKEQASIDLYGSIGLSQLDKDLSMVLPTAFSVQADYKVIENVFVSGLFVNRISFNANSVKATNLISIAPRFEHRWGMVSFPINITEYRRVKMGAAIRLAYFVIGTDDLTSIMGTNEFRSTNVYFGIKANPFKVGSSSKGGSKRGGGSGRKGKVKCYKF